MSMVSVPRPPAFAGGRQPSADQACARCGYGVAARRAPDRCPMCSGREWRPLPRRMLSVTPR